MYPFLWFTLLNLYKSNYMFSKGQIVFGILFAILFIIILVFAYRRDLKIHKHYYKGTLWILIAFISFLSFIAAIKFIFMK